MNKNRERFAANNNMKKALFKGLIYNTISTQLTPKSKHLEQVRA